MNTNASQKTRTEGWSWLFNSRRDHYFVNGVSLCGKWAILGGGDCQDTSDSPCAACLKKLKARKEKANDPT